MSLPQKYITWHFKQFSSSYPHTLTRKLQHRFHGSSTQCEIWGPHSSVITDSGRFTHDNVLNGKGFMGVQRTVGLLSTESISPKSIFFKMSVLFTILHSITAHKFEFSDSLYAAQYPSNKKLWGILDKRYLHAMQSSLVGGQQIPLKCWYVSINYTLSYTRWYFDIHQHDNCNLSFFETWD